MIKSLSIKNYALIEELSVDFSSGLVIITGETGAGKSVVVGALGLILGERASVDVIRGGAEKAVVEALVDVAGNRRVLSLLSDNGLEPAGELLVRREISKKGQSRCFINDTPVTIGLQKQIGEHLVDLHGQHEHQSLLRRETHLEMLDEFGGLTGLVEDLHKAYRRLDGSSARLGETRSQEAHLREKLEFRQFQMQEIDAVSPLPGEEKMLEDELRVLENAETLFAATGKVYELLYGGEQSIHDMLVLVRNQLHELAQIDKGFEAALQEGESAVATVAELAKFAQKYNAKIDFSPDRLNGMRERLGQLSQLKRKYGGSLESVLAHRESIGREVALAENFDAVIAELSEEVERAREECAVLARRLSAKRLETARRVEKGIVGELATLGVPHAKFSAAVAQLDAGGGDLPTARAAAVHYVMAGKKKLGLTPRGCDDVEFFISTNPGEEIKPLVKVASGGEVSRIMLALKSILAKSDRLPVLIFDEIDVGVSGKVAQSVGLALKNLSSFHQVIAITHLPQIAGLADLHCVVYKRTDGKRTVITMKRLTPEERVQEVAKLLSGATVTEAGLKGARELMSVQDVE